MESPGNHEQESGGIEEQSLAPLTASKKLGTSILPQQRLNSADNLKELKANLPAGASRKPSADDALILAMVGHGNRRNHEDSVIVLLEDSAHLLLQERTPPGAKELQPQPKGHVLSLFNKPS